MFGYYKPDTTKFIFFHLIVLPLTGPHGLAPQSLAPVVTTLPFQAPSSPVGLSGSSLSSSTLSLRTEELVVYQRFSLSSPIITSSFTSTVHRIKLFFLRHLNVPEQRKSLLGLYREVPSFLWPYESWGYATPNMLVQPSYGPFYYTSTSFGTVNYSCAHMKSLMCKTL